MSKKPLLITALDSTWFMRQLQAWLKMEAPQVLLLSLEQVYTLNLTQYPKCFLVTDQQQTSAVKDFLQQQLHLPQMDIYTNHPFDAQFVLPEGWSLTLDQSSVKQHFRAWLRLFVMPEFWIADQNVSAVYNGLKKLHFTQQHLINSLQNAQSLADIQMELVNFSHVIQQLYQLSRQDMDYSWVSLRQLVKDLNAWFPRAHFDLVLPNQNVYIFIQIKIFQLFMMNLLKYGHEFNETAQLPVSIKMTGDRMEILLISEYWQQPMDDFLTSDKANAIHLRQWIGFLQMSEDDHGDFQRLTFYLPLPTSSGNHD